MPKDRARQKTYGPQDLMKEQPFPSVPPASVWDGLKEAERRFVLGYLQHGDVCRAFGEAGLEHGQKYVRQLAFNYLQRPKIKAAVARGMAFFAEQTGLHAWQILGALHSHAFHDPAFLYQEDGEGNWQLKPVAEWPLESRLAVQKIRMEEWPTEHGPRRKLEVEFADRGRALTLLGKNLKLFERREQLAPFTLVINSASEPLEKQVGTTIEGIGLQIRVPAPDEA